MTAPARRPALRTFRVEVVRKQRGAVYVQARDSAEAAALACDLADISDDRAEWYAAGHAEAVSSEDDEGGGEA